MKLLVLALIVLLSQEISGAKYETKYLDVPVDHFSFTNQDTFKLKYLVNDSWWVDDGPIFFYTGNEGTIENFAENTGFMYDIAPQFNALLIFAEHRYYGTSLPYGNLSYTSPKYLGYLTSSQALADYVFLIEHLHQIHPNPDRLIKNPVIAFGGSYGGMLAAWIRMKYPASVAGAIAASAPIWQFQNLTPCENFNRIVTDVYQSASIKDCSIPIAKSWQAIRNVTANEEGLSWLSSQWKLCTPLKNPAGIEQLINWVSEIVVNMAMVNYPYPTKFLAPLPAQPVRNFCSRLFGDLRRTDDKGLLTALGSALEVYTNFTRTTKCNNINLTAADLGESGWDFQACTEMIMPMCSTDKDMFENTPWDFKKYSEDCFAKWGVKQADPNIPVLEYGGKDLKAASNIVFSNGLLDPWSGGGVLSNMTSTVAAVIIPEGAHHLDLREENQYDPLSVIEARKFHVHHIRKWIRQYYVKGYKPFYDQLEYIHLNDV